MQRPRIAIIGDMELHGDDVTNAGGIALRLATSFKVEVGVRSIARTTAVATAITSILGRDGITPWITSRSNTEPADADHSATVQMGDPLDIPSLFGHDVVILAMHDRRLRRFLADLPVHTKPDVRIMTSLHIDHTVLAGESLSDLLRSDVLIGTKTDFEALPDLAGPEPLENLHARMRGANLRMAVCWDESTGQCTIATVDEGLTRAVAPEPGRDADIPMVMATVAIGLFQREGPIEVAERVVSELSKAEPAGDEDSNG